VFGRVDPVIVICEARLGSDGSDDRVAGDRGFGTSFEDSVKVEPHAFSSDREEAEGMCVAIKSYFRDSMRDADRSWAAPEDEVFFDCCPVRVVTYLAFAAVAFYGGRNAEGRGFWFGPISMLRLGGFDYRC